MKFAVLCRLLQHQVTGLGMRDLHEKSAEVELNHHAQPYSNWLDFESRSREIPSFRINERSLALIFVCYLIYTYVLKDRCSAWSNFVLQSFQHFTAHMIKK